MIFNSGIWQSITLKLIVFILRLWIFVCFEETNVLFFKDLILCCNMHFACLRSVEKWLFVIEKWMHWLIYLPSNIRWISLWFLRQITAILHFILSIKIKWGMIFFHFFDSKYFFNFQNFILSVFWKLYSSNSNFHWINGITNNKVTYLFNLYSFSVSILNWN
jgi:hypothetical protein